MSSGFVSETELAERRKAKQEEWERVRQSDQPLEAPEEQYDHRSLFDRLEEQKQRKQQEYEEAHKLKNMIKGLDDDEVGFLDLVDRKKMEAEQMKELEEKQELLEFRKKVEKLEEDTLDQRIQAEIRTPRNNIGNSSSISSQHKLLKGVVIRKRATEEKDTDKKESGDHIVNGNQQEDCCEKKRKRLEEQVSPPAHKFQVERSGLTCVGILPSLCNYEESTDESEQTPSSESESESNTKYDLVGRKIVYKAKETEAKN